MNEYVHKGNRIAVAGRLVKDTWQGKGEHEGKSFQRTKLVVGDLLMLGGRRGGNGSIDDGPPPMSDEETRMWQICRAQGRDAGDYDDAGYLIACGTNAAWHHWRYFVLQTKCHGVPGKDGLTDCQRGGLPAITFPLDSLESDDSGTWEEVIPYWSDLVIEDITPLTTHAERGRRSPLTDERRDMLWQLLDTFYPRIRTLGKRRLLAILDLLTEGYTTGNIADLFRISYQGVRKHRLRLQRFLAWLADIELPFDGAFPRDQYPIADYSAVLA